MRTRLATAIAAVALATLLAAPSAWASGGYVVDPDAYQPQSTVQLTSNPKGVAAASFVAGIAMEGGVAVLDTCTPKVCSLGSVQQEPAGAQPSDAAIAIAPNAVSRTVYVSNSGSGTVTVVPWLSGVAQPPVTLTVGGEPTGLALSPDGRSLYVSDKAAAQLVVVDTTSLTVSARVAVGAGPWGVAVSPDGRYAYVAGNSAGTVSVVDTAARTTVATVPVGANPGEVALDPSGRTLYVTNNGAASVSVIDTGTRVVTATIPVGSQPWGVALTATHAFVANYGSGTVSVIDTATRRIIATVKTGTGPFGVAVDGDQSVLVTNYGSKTVAQIALTAYGPAPDWSSSRRARTVTATFPLTPAVDYEIVARKGAATRTGTCRLRPNGTDLSCAVRVPRGTWRVSVTARLPWQPVAVGQQNRRFTF